MLQYAVVIGTDNARKVCVCNTIEDCQKLVKQHIIANNITSLYRYGWDDEGDVFELDNEEFTMFHIGRISFEGEFVPCYNIDDKLEII